MKTADIGEKVTIKGQLFPGTYTKRKMRSKDLYCWFCEDADRYPHASIEVSHAHSIWTDFHVTFPVTKEKGAWESGTEQVSYSVWVEINQNTDQISVVRTTDASRWKLAGNKPAFNGFADANRKSLEFAKAFYSAAFLGVT